MRDGELTYAQQIEMMGHLNAWKARALAAETRAEAAERRAGELEGALRKAVAWFRDYERQHRAKGTTEGSMKADTNAERADFLLAALLPATQAEGEK